MFKANVKVSLNAAQMERRFGPRLDEAQAWLDGAVIKDTDEFVPMAQGILAGSALRYSDIGLGVIRYDTPYARKLYYGSNFTFARDKHSKATHHWFEKARSVFLDNWGKGVARILGGFWRRNG